MKQKKKLHEAPTEQSKHLPFVDGVQALPSGAGSLPLVPWLSSCSEPAGWGSEDARIRDTTVTKTGQMCRGEKRIKVKLFLGWESEKWMHPPNKTGSRMLTEALFIIIQMQTTNNRMDKRVQYVHITKMKTLLKTAQVNLRDNLLHQRSQKWKQEYIAGYICMKLKKRQNTSA